MMSTATGNLIRLHREKLGLLQKDVASKIGVTAVFLGRVENGQILLPAEHVARVAKALSLEPDEIGIALEQDHARKLRQKISGKKSNE